MGCFDKALALSLMSKERHIWKDLYILHSSHFLSVRTAYTRQIYHEQNHKVSGLSPSFALMEKHQKTVCGILGVQGETGIGVTSKNQTCMEPLQSTNDDRKKKRFRD